MKPRLSIVIPCYEEHRYLVDTITSLIGTGLREIEVLLVDDGSSEPLSPFFATLQNRFPELTIRFFVQSNGGPAKGRNTGIRHAAADIILPLDSDDLIETSHLGEFVAAIESHSDVDIVYGDFKCFGLREEYCQAVEWNKANVARTNGLPYCSLFRKSLWQRLGGYDETVPYGVEDWQFWIHGKHCGARGLYLGKHLLKYRVRPLSLTSTVLRDDLVMKAAIIRSLPAAFSWTQKSWADQIKCDAGVLDQIQLGRGNWSHQVGVMPEDSLCALDLALIHRSRGEHDRAGEWFIKAFALDPLPQRLLESAQYAVALEGSLFKQNGAKSGI